jgi:hypothetical protein
MAFLEKHPMQDSSQETTSGTDPVTQRPVSEENSGRKQSTSKCPILDVHLGNSVERMSVEDTSASIRISGYAA